MGGQGKTRLIAIVDDDEFVRSGIHSLLRSVGLKTVGLKTRSFDLSGGSSWYPANTGRPRA